MIRNNLIFFILILVLLSCALRKAKNKSVIEEGRDDYFTKVHETKCEPGTKVIKYRIGDLVCTKNMIKVNPREKIQVKFIITNKDSDDPYEYGYQELHRYKDGKIIEKLKLRKDEDAYWSMVPFIRIRKQKYLSDLDDDGFLEFAVLPFHPGSAIWMRARIFSLKARIEYWGEGKYQFEGDTYVQLGCMDCSKFNPKACEKCK